MDTRIGRKYLTGSLGYGGPCFPRDNIALAFIARELGVEAKLAEVTDSMNRSIAENVSDRLQALMQKGTTVAVLGLSYKPYSHVTDESQGVYIARHLSKNGFRVVGFDPMAAHMPLDDIKKNIVVLDSVHECLQQAAAVLITTPDPYFASLTTADFKNEWAEVLVMDFWRLLRTELDGKPGIKYVAAGLSEDDSVARKRLRTLWCGENSEASIVGVE